MASAADPDPPVAGAGDAGGLCTACGLCCDGTLFGRVTVYPDDFATLARYAMTPLPRGDGFAFEQPCPRLRGTVCGIYPERFVTCRRFRCALLRGVEAGAVALPEAQARVATAHAQIAALGPHGRTGAARRARQRATRDWATLSDPTARAAAAREQVAILALERFLDRHFRVPKDGSTPRDG